MQSTPQLTSTRDILYHGYLSPLISISEVCAALYCCVLCYAVLHFTLLHCTYYADLLYCIVTMVLITLFLVELYRTVYSIKSYCSFIILLSFAILCCVCCNSFEVKVNYAYCTKLRHQCSFACLNHRQKLKGAVSGGSWSIRAHNALPSLYSP